MIDEIPTITFVADKPLSEIGNVDLSSFSVATDYKIEIGCTVATNRIFQSKAATNFACLMCNDTGIVDGEFDGALECVCQKKTNKR